jgi:Domain of unknown function (DUF3291)
VAHLAIYSFAVLREPAGHPRVQGFYDRLEAVLRTAEGADGFIAVRLDMPDGFGPRRFFDPELDAGSPQSLSLWTSLESLFAFVYRGLHIEALRLRREWLVEPDWPTHAAWWVPDNQMPSWEDAAHRLEHLHDHGPTPFAFSLKRPFDAEGRSAVLDRASIAALSVS